MVHESPFTDDFYSILPTPYEAVTTLLAYFAGKIQAVLLVLRLRRSEQSPLEVEAAEFNLNEE